MRVLCSQCTGQYNSFKTTKEIYTAYIADLISLSLWLGAAFCLKSSHSFHYCKHSINIYKYFSSQRLHLLSWERSWIEFLGVHLWVWEFVLVLFAWFFFITDCFVWLLFFFLIGIQRIHSKQWTCKKRLLFDFTKHDQAMCSKTECAGDQFRVILPK